MHWKKSFSKLLMLVYLDYYFSHNLNLHSETYIHILHYFKRLILVWMSLLCSFCLQIFSWTYLRQKVNFVEICTFKTTGKYISHLIKNKQTNILPSSFPFHLWPEKQRQIFFLAFLSANIKTSTVSLAVWNILFFSFSVKVKHL